MTFSIYVMDNVQVCLLHIVMKYYFLLIVVNVVGKYHTLCDKTSLNNSSLLCFVDDDYYCLCDANDIAQCFSNYRKFDQCNLCLVGGQCIKGEIDTPSDYLCLCPPCYFGSTCQHNTKLFSYISLYQQYSSSMV